MRALLAIDFIVTCLVDWLFVTVLWFGVYCVRLLASCSLLKCSIDLFVVCYCLLL